MLTLGLINLISRLLRLLRCVYNMELKWHQDAHAYRLPNLLGQLFPTVYSLLGLLKTTPHCDCEVWYIRKNCDCDTFVKRDCDTFVKTIVDTLCNCVSKCIANQHTIICIYSNFQGVKKLPLLLCLSFCTFVFVKFRAILPLCKQSLKGYLSEDNRIMPVVKRVQ